MPLLATLALIAAAIVVYVFVFGWLQNIRFPYAERGDLFVARGIDVLFVAWLFWIGSAVGSFLNVVAWRLPRGATLGGRSHCPRCETQLTARDNFPVFGWLALAGRCRTCRLPVSSRYPIVEAAVGVSFTLVGIFELYRLALPNQLLHWHGGPLWAPRVDGPLLLVLLYHLVALALSWALGLVRYGRSSPAAFTGGVHRGSRDRPDAALPRIDGGSLADGVGRRLDPRGRVSGGLIAGDDVTCRRRDCGAMLGAGALRGGRSKT